MKSFESVVADIRLQSQTGTVGVWSMSLERTEFPAGSTGVLEAVTRSGTKLAIPVTEVTVDDEGVFWHTVEKPLAAGTDVIGRVGATG